MIRISQWRESHCRKTLVSEQRKKSIRAGLRVTVRDPSRKFNDLSKEIGGREIVADLSRSISSTRIGKPVLMMDIKVFKEKHISR